MSKKKTHQGADIRTFGQVTRELEQTRRDLQVLAGHVDILLAVYGEKNVVRNQWATRLGISTASFDKRRHQFMLHPRQRSDKGARKKHPDIEAWVRRLADIKRVEHALRGKWISTRRAIEIAEAAGLIPAGALTPNSACAVARQIGANLVSPERS
jgi:hypothetical protein